MRQSADRTCGHAGPYRRAARRAAPGRRRPLQGVHALLEGLDRQHLARGGTGARDSAAARLVAAGGRAPAAVGCAPAGLLPGGEQAGRTRAQRWLGDSLACYGERHDDLAGDQTSRLGAYLRFGCLSPLELAVAARGRPGGEEFCRQLAWRDFFYQVTAAFPDWRGRTTGRTARPGGMILTRWRPGARGAPGYRSWTPGCASSLPRGSCTTGPG